MGGPRVFGFLEDRVTHHPVEAPIIRDLAARALAGESLASLTRWLQNEGIETTMGSLWRTQTVKQFLTNPRMWGMRVHQGQVIGKAVWEPIITADQGDRLIRLFSDPTRRTNRSARTYLLTGMLRCGKCGKPLFSAPKNGKRRYGCRTGPDTRGCGGVYIYAEMLEEFIANVVLMRLDSIEMHQTLTGAGHDDETIRRLADDIQADLDALEELAAEWADRKISKAEWYVARDRITPRLEASQRALARLTNHDAIHAHIGHGAELRGNWDGLNLSRQRAIVKAVLDYATILPAAVPGRHGLDPTRVEAVWRL
jgi:ElaB/YqjD/DUF883 family membrane-anchored ribosome-binding protein